MLSRPKIPRLVRFARHPRVSSCGSDNGQRKDKTTTGDVEAVLVLMQTFLSFELDLFTIARLSLLAHHYTYALRAQFASARFESNTRYRFCRHTAPASLRI
jgi:hypothetical protein